MVDFAHDDDDEAAVDPSDLFALYNSLDRKASHVTPRDPQKEALTALTSSRTTRDLVLKMSTGYGKTTVALVYLYSYMTETRRPVVYLCPTAQLVDQVLSESENLGIQAVTYPAGQPHPAPEAIAGNAILVCTYDKLFNARTSFDRDDVDLIPEAIVLDDAHSGIQEVRDGFTLRISRRDHEDLYTAMLNLLRAPCKDHQAGIWEGIEEQDDGAVLEVPFWAWAPLITQVRPLLEQRYQEEEKRKRADKAVLFQWGYLREHLRWCRCIVSGGAIEILADPPAVQLARPFAGAKHRLFMSATLSDDSALVRELGCDPGAAKNPIVPPSDAGVGERMLLAPSLIDPKLDRDWVMQVCKILAKRWRVVVLTASEKKAKEWIAVDATAVIGDEVEDAVAGLKAGTSSFVAFAQRYDGVDLPDDACRVLVLDGMPIGQGLADDYDRHIAGRTGGAYRRWIYRVEQGMGRAVRSQADYAVVLLTGPDLVNFLAKKDVVEQMGAVTKAQLKASEKLTAMAKTDNRPASKVVTETVLQCLGRDPGWKVFYEKNVKKKIEKSTDKPDETQITIAAAEQQAQSAVMSRDSRKAAKTIGDAINACHPPAAQTGWLLQRKANYSFDQDPAEGLKIQRAAYDYNNQMCTPPSGVTVRKSKPGGAGSMVLAWYNTFDHPNGAIAEVARLKAKLSFDVKSRVIEEGIKEAAEIFGAIGSRPENLYRRGPDDLWDWPTFSWVIEAKNERSGKLPKVDGGQLHSAMEWFKESYPERTAVPIVVARVPEEERDAFFPDGTLVLTPEGLELLVKNIELFVAALVQKEPIAWTPEAVGQLLLTHKLAAEQFAGTYTKPLSK